MKLHHWSGVGKIEINMPWAPFHSDLGKVALYESLGSEDALERQLDITGYKDAIDRDSLAWKLTGLRILDTNIDDEELMSPLPREEDDGIEVLTRKRKAELHEGSTRTHHFTNDTQDVTESNFASRKELGTNTVGGLFSATDDLTHFMEMQGRTVKRQKSSVTQKDIPQFEKISMEKLTAGHDHVKLPQLESAESHNINTCFPSTIRNNSAQTVVVSSNFMTRRNVIRLMIANKPDLILIERDWLACRISQVTNKSECLDEGDLIVSPACAIICTTIVKINQRPLPGEGKESYIRRRIRHVAQRFESLHVLIEVPGDTSMADLDEVVYSAMNELVLFSASLEGRIAVSLVPGGEENLAKWIGGIVSSYAAETGTMKLLAEATLWETFLQQSGLNAYAAQAILGQLKAVVSDMSAAEMEEPPGEFGLTAFVAMSRDERIARFESLSGGRRVIELVSRLLDAQWTP